MNTDINTEELVQNARIHSAPQDFRYIMFAVKSQLCRNKIVSSHIKEIEESCVIKRDLNDKNKIHLVTENGLKCSAVLNCCYPQVKYM